MGNIRSAEVTQQIARFKGLVMTTREFKLHDGKNGAAIAIRVVTRAKKNEIAEIMSDGTLKVRVTAPPVEGKANKAVIDLIADVLDVPASSVEIVAGATSREKLISIIDLDAAAVQRKLSKYLS